MNINIDAHHENAKEMRIHLTRDVAVQLANCINPGMERRGFDSFIIIADAIDVEGEAVLLKIKNVAAMFTPPETK